MFGESLTVHPLVKRPDPRLVGTLRGHLNGLDPPETARIIGTSEAFSGYGRDVVAAGWLAEDAQAFLAAIGEAAQIDLPAFDPAARALYENTHSFAAATRRMAQIMRQARD